jgi:hypothetical protein
MELVAMTVPTLPAAFSDDDLLVSKRGGPVWPLRSQEELLGLEHLAGAFGGRVVMVPARAARPAAPDSTELVVGIGSSVASQARLYAHLTRRSHVIVSTLEALRDLSDVKIVVATWDELTLSAFESIHEYSRSYGAVGLIVVAGASCRLRVLRHSAASALAGPLGRRATILLVPDGQAFAEVAGRLRAASVADLPSVRSLIEAPTGLLCIWTHSDGVDAPLGRGEILCEGAGREPRLPAAELARRSLLPNCRVNGFCHRKKLPRHEAVEDPSLIGASAVASRIALMLTCFGALGADSLSHPRWGLLDRMLDNPTIGAVVTSWGIIMPRARDAVVLAGAFSSGKPMAKAIDAWQRSSHGDMVRLLLFGDPRARLPSSAAAPSARATEDEAVFGSPAAPSVAALYESKLAPHARLAAGPRGHARDARGQRIRFLRHLIDLAAAHEALSTFTSNARRAMDVLERSSTLSHAVEAERSIVECLAAFEVQGGDMRNEMTRHADRVEIVPSSGPCPNCGLSLRASRWSMTDARFPPRVISMCPRCGESAMFEPGSPYRGTTLAAEGRRATLVGTPSARWPEAMALTIRTPRLAKRFWMHTHGERALDFGALEEGLSGVSVLALNAGELTIWRARASGGAALQNGEALAGALH